MMPEMDGIELCRKIRETPEISHIPIILLTARTGETHYLEGIESGADEYFSKPVSVPKLVARIENLLQSRQKLHKLFADQVVLEPREIAVLPADQLFLRNAIDIAEENMQTEGFDVDAFAKQMAVSRATLNRKIKAITGTSPKAFIRSMRIKRAAQLLASSDLPINEIFFQVGFYDASNFSRVFKKETGMTPSQYRDSHPHQDRVNNPESAPRQA
jgi:AraC-like DNA-binding protein